MELASKNYPGIKWFCAQCISDPPLEVDDRTQKQDAKIDKLAVMFDSMQKKMESVLTVLGTEKVEEKIGVHVSELLTDQKETEEKKCNMIVFNLPEKDSEDEDLAEVKNLLNYVNSEVNTDELTKSNVVRIGRKKTTSESHNKIRPIKLVFNEPDTKWKLLKRASRLKDSTTFKGVGLNLDKTTKERREDEVLRAKLKEERGKRPEDDLIIFRKHIIKRADKSQFLKNLSSEIMTTSGVSGASNSA